MKKLILCLVFLSAAATVQGAGSELIEQRCMPCHVIDGKGGEKMAAPPMYAIWHHYRQVYPQKEEFVAAIDAWLQQPRKESSIMAGAVNKFGLMETPELAEGEGRRIAEYLYAQEYKLPSWYRMHYKKREGEHLSAERNIDASMQKGEAATRQQQLPENSATP